MIRPRLPVVTEELLHKIQGRLPSVTYRRWMEDVTRALAEVAPAGWQDAIAALAVKLGSPDGSIDGIPEPEPVDFSINGDASIVTDGTPASGVVSIALDGDDVYPVAGSFYGTDQDGEKGFVSISSTVTATADGIARLDSGYQLLGVVETSSDLPGTGNPGEAYRVIGQGIYAWDGSQFSLDEVADGTANIVPANDLASIEAISGVGFAARTATDQWANRSLADSANIEWVNPDGVTGNPSADLTDITPTTGGTLQLTQFDAKGRRTHEEAATAVDMPFVPVGPITATDVQGAIEQAAEQGGGVLPVVTGEVLSGQPVFVYASDGSLIYAPVI